MKDSKAQLRRQLKQARLGLSGEERQANSALINQRLLELVDWSVVKFLHCFEPLMSLGEVDVSSFMTDLGQAHPAIDMFTSRQLDDVWNVVPVDSEKPVGTPAFDVIIVPMLGFDLRNLHRLGYGGGYYDRFLAVQPQAQKIGVCFELGKVSNLPYETYDISLDTVVTETAIYKG